LKCVLLCYDDTTYMLDGQGIMVRFSTGCILLFLKVSTLALEHTQPSIKEVQGSVLPEHKEAGVWHWPLTPYSVKNEWGYTSNPNTYWYVHRDSSYGATFLRSSYRYTGTNERESLGHRRRQHPWNLFPRPRHDWSINPPPYMEPTVHSSVHNKPPLEHILRQINPTYPHTELLTIHFNIPSHLRIHFILDLLKPYN